MKKSACLNLISGNLTHFGLLPSRLTYNEYKEGSREGVVSTIDVLRKESNEYTSLKTAIDAYNAVVRSRLDIRFRRFLLDPETDSDGNILIAQTLKNIDKILQKRGLREDERKYLMKIREELAAIPADKLGPEGIVEGVASIDPEAAKHAGELLMFLTQRVVEGKETADQWKGKKTFADIESVYETAIRRSDDYEFLIKNPQGDIDAQKSRENKNLFLALMEGKTEGFKSDFSDMFDSNYETNLARYPFLYKTWLEIQSPELATKIEVQEKKVKDYVPTTDLQEILDLSGKNAGVHFSAIEAIPVKPDAAYWQKRADVINSDIAALRAKANENPLDPRVDAGRLKDDATLLEAHMTYAQQQYELAKLKAQENKIAKNFTKESLRASSNRDNLIEAMMLWYQKAAQTVDQRELFHPAVRRLLVANIFEKGFELNATQNAWMLETLSSSRYFDAKTQGRELDSPRRAALELAYLGGKVADDLEKYKKDLELIEGMMTLQGKSGAEADAVINDLASRFPVERIQFYSQIPPYKLIEKRAEIEAENLKREAFLQMAHEVIQNPYADTEGQPSAALAQLDQNGDGHLDANESELSIVSAGDLSRAQGLMGKIEMNYNLLTLKGRVEEKDDAELLDRMGINVNALYKQYVLLINENPDMHVRNWPELLGPEGDPDKLASFLERIIPEGTASESQKGKQALLAVLKSINDGATADPKIMQQRNTAKDVVLQIADHLINTERVEGYAERVMPEVEKRLKGFGISETAQKHLGMIWDMATGPGNLFSADRVAAVIGLIGIYKFLKTKPGKVTGVLFAINQIYKRQTGRELPELLGLNTIGETAEGTYEEAIAQHGIERMNGFEKSEDNIDKTTHLLALKALGPIPVHKLFAWHEVSDPNGANYDAEKSITLFNELGLKKGALKLTGANRAIRERFIYREVFSHFIEFTAEQQDKGNELERKALKERWVTSIHNPAHKREYTDFVYTEIMQRYKGRPEAVTFELMMKAETNPYQVEAAMDKNGLAPALETVTNWADQLEDWVRRGIINPGDGYAEDFFEAAGATAKEGADMLGNMAESLGLKLYFAKESVKFWYQNNEWEIRRMGEGMWGIFTSSATLPIHMVYGGLEIVVPWVDTKLRQVNELIRSDVLATPVNPEQGFTMADIAGPQAWEIGRNGLVVIDAINGKPVINRNPKQNPQFANYGLFQHDFYEAYRAGPMNEAEVKAGEGARYYHENNDVGYLITEVNHQTAGIDINNPMFSSSPENRYRQMETKAREEAVEFYISQNIPQPYIEKYMYPIHSVLQTTPYEAVVISFRLPQPESVEGMLLESGHWVDNKNPNAWKHRAPVEFKPGQTWENLKEMTGLKYDAAREAYSFAGRYGVQAIYMWRATMETMGQAAEAIVKMFYADQYKDRANWIGEVFKTKEETNQYLDEMSTAASNPALASSTFYKDVNNANMYRLAQEFAIKYDQDVYLGFFKNAYATDAKGKTILDDKNQPVVYKGVERIGDRPADYRKANFINYYENVWLGEQRRDPIPRFAEYMNSIPDDDTPVTMAPPATPPPGP